jgi:cyclopropane fatty-acyl-phospholipid synthase-like methyltransferase
LDNLSNEYKEQLKTLHLKNKMGKNSKRKIPKLFNMPEFLEKYKPNSIIDYGCGSGGVVNFLLEKYNIVEGYDPCVEKLSTWPTKKYDVLVSMDVLEHIEPEFLDDNLKLIETLFNKAAYLDIHTGASPAFLPDGRNAHLIQEQPNFWREKISKNMNVKIVNEFWRAPVKKGANILNYIFIVEKI